MYIVHLYAINYLNLPFVLSSLKLSIIYDDERNLDILSDTTRLQIELKYGYNRFTAGTFLLLFKRN